MIRILFLASNPVDQAHLRVRQEFDELRQTLDSAAHGRRFALLQEFAAAPDQLQALLFRHRPHIVHFSGHGTAGGLVFEGDDGSSHLVAPQTLRDLFLNFKQQVRCVVLNACYSESQSAAIATVIDSVVGMSDVLTDEAARAFAVAFHRSLANGTTLADAVSLGCNQLDLQNLAEAHKPQLLAERIDPTRVRALDWDDTAASTETNSLTSEISTGGGAAIQGNATAGRDIIGRDKIEQHYYFYPPPSERPKEKIIHLQIEDEAWQALRKLVTELYPQGPVEQQIWKRAGGDLSMLNFNQSGKALWIVALDLVKKGGGGKSINLYSLIETMEEDYPNNQDIIRLKESFSR